MARVCGNCIWFRWLDKTVTNIYRDGYCVKYSCYTKHNDIFADDCSSYEFRGYED
jgi:hypothetical protein